MCYNESMDDNPNIPRAVGIETLTPKRRNPNRGTQRGAYVLDASFEQVGAGRSILVDGQGNVICGDHVLQAAADAGITEVLLVEGRPDRLVAVQRSDLPAESARARLMVYYDQRAAQLGTGWDGAVLFADLQAGLDLGQMFFPSEIEAILSHDLAEQAADLLAGMSSADLEESLQLPPINPMPSQPTQPNETPHAPDDPISGGGGYILCAPLPFVDEAKRAIAAAIGQHRSQL